MISISCGHSRAISADQGGESDRVSVPAQLARPAWLASASRKPYIPVPSDRSAATALPRPETGPRAMRDRREPKRLPRDYPTAGRLWAPCAVSGLSARRVPDRLAAQHLHRQDGESDDARRSRPACRRDRIGAFHEQSQISASLGRSSQAEEHLVLAGTDETPLWYA